MLMTLCATSSKLTRHGSLRHGSSRHGSLHYLCSADLSKIFSYIFFNRFCPVEKSGVTHVAYMQIH